MHDVVLILHLFGLMMGAGGGFGSMLVARRANALPPEQAMPLRALGPMLARLSLFGLALMWITGISLALMMGGFGVLPAMFWIKFVFVLSLTIVAFVVEFTYAQIKGGNMKAASRLAILGPLAGLSSWLAVIFAVLAFH